MTDILTRKSACCGANLYQLCPNPVTTHKIRCENCHKEAGPIQDPQKEEFIKILENLARMSPCLKGSYDYKKGLNDANWFYHRAINKVIKILNETQIPKAELYGAESKEGLSVRGVPGSDTSSRE